MTDHDCRQFTRWWGMPWRCRTMSRPPRRGPTRSSDRWTKTWTTNSPSRSLSTGPWVIPPSSSCSSATRHTPVNPPLRGLSTVCPSQFSIPAHPIPSPPLSTPQGGYSSARWLKKKYPLSPVRWFKPPWRLELARRDFVVSPRSLTLLETWSVLVWDFHDFHDFSGNEDEEASKSVSLNQACLFDTFSRALVYCVLLSAPIKYQVSNFLHFCSSWNSLAGNAQFDFTFQISLF